MASITTSNTASVVGTPPPGISTNSGALTDPVSPVYPAPRLATATFVITPPTMVISPTTACTALAPIGTGKNCNTGGLPLSYPVPPLIMFISLTLYNVCLVSGAKAFTVNVNALSQVVVLSSIVVSPRSIANVLNVTRPAISPDSNNSRPCGKLLYSPDASWYCKSLPPRFTASTRSKLVSPLISVPRSASVSHVISESTAPIMLKINGYGSLATMIAADIDPALVVNSTADVDVGLAATVN